jgi:uncharacterized protein (UPF0333 family)
MEKKAQASMEYMIMLALSLGIFAAIMYIVSNLMTTSSVQIGIDSAVRAVGRMREAADFIYVHGHPSKTQLNVYIPPNIENAMVIDNKTINLRIAIKEAYTDVYSIPKGSVIGNLSMMRNEGYYLLSFESNPDNSINMTVLI